MALTVVSAFTRTYTSQLPEALQPPLITLQVEHSLAEVVKATDRNTWDDPHFTAGMQTHRCVCIHIDLR